MAYPSSVIHSTQVIAIKRTGTRQSKWLPLWFLLPSMLILLALQVGPSLYSFYLSTTQLDPNTGRNINVGLANFVYLFNSPTFRDSLWHTASRDDVALDVPANLRHFAGLAQPDHR